MTLLHARQLLTTAIGFALFAIMGVGYALMVSPLILLLRKDPSQRRILARAITQKSFSWYLKLLTVLRTLSVRVVHRERLQGEGLLIAASHPTLLDTVILMSLVSNTNCIVKASLKENRVTRAPIACAGYIGNDEGEAVVDGACDALSKKENLLVFPEGTRTKPGVVPHLRHGVSQIALQSQTDIVPVRITCQPIALRKGEPWYQTAHSTMYYCVTVGEPIRVAPYLAIQHEQGRPIAVRELTKRLHLALFDEDDRPES